MKNYSYSIIDQTSEAGLFYSFNFIQTTIPSTSDMIAAVQAANNPNIDILVIIRYAGNMCTESTKTPCESETRKPNNL